MLKLGLGPRRDILQPLPVNDVFRDVVTVLRSIAPESKPSEKQDEVKKVEVSLEEKRDENTRIEDVEVRGEQPK